LNDDQAGTAFSTHSNDTSSIWWLEGSCRTSPTTFTCIRRTACSNLVTSCFI
jgi:hypothetical protein